MKFLIVENKIREELMCEVADFLWNNGNEVHLRDNFEDDFSKIDGQNALDYCDCLIFFKLNKPSGNKGKDFDCSKDFGLYTNHRKLIVLVFGEDGVYTNAIPYPHKIYHFETLDKKSLIKFQNWSKRLNLFVKA